MSSFIPALLDCSRTVAALVHLPAVYGTYPKPRQVLAVHKHASRLLQRFVTQRVCPLHLILVERATHTQVLVFYALPAPRRLSESLNVQECLVAFFFFFTPELYLGREGSSNPAGTVRGCREGVPGGSGAGDGCPEDRPPARSAQPVQRGAGRGRAPQQRRI